MALRTDQNGHKISRQVLREGEIVVEMSVYELELSWSPLREERPGSISEEIAGTVREVGGETILWRAARSRSMVTGVVQEEWSILHSHELPEKYLAAIKNFLKQLKITWPKIK